MASIEPGIALVRTADGYRVVQDRPPVGPVLCRLPVEDALQQVTRLLPICGDAQRIAATRAVEASRGEAEPPQRRSRRDEALLREQLRSSAWRFCVDWPQLAGEPQALDPLRTLRQAADLADARAELASLLDGLEAVATLDALEAWVRRGGVAAARIVSRAMAVDAQAGLAERVAEAPLRRPADVLAVCRDGLAVTAAESPVTPPPGEVGALAMARHPLIRQLPGRYGPVARRFLAQALDAAFLCTANGAAAGFAADGARAGGSGPAPGTGLGWAMTARGPLVHRVVLDSPDAERASRWDVLAPTDWHFAPGGPVARVVATTTARPEAVRWWVAAFDPCAAWSVRGGGERDGMEG